ncbi:Alpha-(1,3)-fucosyltransferase C [Folsomia candida]|uniref:Fucosyltransferase n=1 Tax=Folsomia candida TaxID=158441 RepID=A0A226F3F7_FOLCA|nr:Alpha-(1,3)-fucosyltransferase C [Folsomia candida]
MPLNLKVPGNRLDISISDNSDDNEYEDSNFPIELSKNSLQLIQYPAGTHPVYRKWNSNINLNNRPKKILIWNAYWESTAMWHKIFYEIVYKQCPQSNCVMTVDKNELDHADAVLFHLIDIAKENYTFPANRNPDQVWIGMTYEPPYILKFSNLNFTRLNGIFNRTMSYRSDSDVVVRHGTYVKVVGDIQAYPNYMSDWIGSHKVSPEKNYAEGKRRLISWFASSRGCKSQSRREKYVKELQSYIPVDIFGACGPFKCGTQKTMRNPYKVEHDDCYLLVSVAYKFVLAAENSVCEDYVTEKLYNHLKLNVVPVVYGGADYNKYAPPNSFIDASKFSPKELGEYLLLLDKNDTLYNQYFEWKQNYYIASHDG